MGRALASPGRLALLEVLAQGPRTVEPLAREAGLSFANASRHLQVLREAGLVRATREGLHVRYALAAPEAHALLSSLRDLAEGVRREIRSLTLAYERGGSNLEAVSQRELLRRLKDGTAIAIDVRPAEEYWTGHIRGALCVPLPELRRRLRQLPADREIVAYCRGPYCVLADEAVAFLRARGRAARRLADGFPEWRAAGLAVEAEGSVR